MNCKNIFKIISLIIILQSTSFSQSGWQIQHDVSNEEYYDMYFINANTGWAIETGFIGKILKTINNGQNWIIISNGDFHEGTGISFYDEMIGWITASSGFRYRTTNGGQNWLSSGCDSCSSVDDFIDIQFINQLTGFAYGDQTIYKSTDGGINYHLLQGNVSAYNGHFLDANLGWVGGYNGVSRTTNGGLNWTRFNVYNENSIRNIFFANINTGWICLNSGKVYKSTNSGENWTDQAVNNNFHLFKIQFINENTGWIVGDSGTVLKTMNDGANWNRQTSPSSRNFKGIFMLSANEGWICGQQFILHTTNGGGPIGITPVSSEVPNNFSLSQNYPNPFNPSTKIRFEVAGSSASQTSLSVYDITGKEVSILVNEFLQPGTYEINFDASNYPSGTYFYRLETENYTESKKMVLLK